MTLDELRAALAAADRAAPLVFRAGDGEIGGETGGEIGGGYHVTELRHAAVTGIDCGGNVARWDEAWLQLLDGPGGDHMTVGTFLKILDRSVAGVPGLGAAPLRVEFAPGNRGLRSHAAGAPEVAGGRAIVPLEEEHALCKPALAARVAGTSNGCCGSAPGTVCG